MRRDDGCVVMVSDGDGTGLTLQKLLKEAGVRVQMYRTCAQVRQVLDGPNSPTVLFSDTSLPDGTWIDVLTLVLERNRHVPVIVVSRVVDINLYINALEKGASDFIVPPFYLQDIWHVLKCAIKHPEAEKRLAAA
jgi:FixJ family two-component response regulator